MKRVLNLIFCVAFIVCISLPLVTMNFEKNVKSDIDNAYLPELHYTGFENVDDVVTEYVAKRIGFRKTALDLYQNINSNLFGVMEHPTFMYGKEGHMFLKAPLYIWNYQHTNLDEAGINVFTEALQQFQFYTEREGKTFLYFLIPDKETVYPEFYPDTVNVLGTVSRTDQLEAALQKREIPYFYCKDTMQAAKDTMPVNNVKFDVSHWNQNGAFVSIQRLYDILRERHPNLTPLRAEAFDIQQVVIESLEQSRFRIDEPVPSYTLKENTAINKTQELRDTVKIYFPDNYFCHYENPACADAPKLLIFGDSYLAELDQFFIGSFSTYTYIHRYNVYNQECFEYYVNQLDPDIVIFENPERSLIIDLNQPTPAG